MATISLYASKINNMPSLINDVKKAVTDYKSELANLKNKALKVNTSVCDLSDVVSEISSSTKTQDEKIASLEALQKNSEQFVSDTVKIDNEVADLINKRKDEFYNAYTYLKPECEKSGWEKFCDGVKSVGEWCKENWKSLAKIALAVVVIAALAVATALTGGTLGVILGGALMGALIGGASGGIMGGITNVMSGGSFLEGFADGMLTGTVTGAITGAAASGLTVAGQAVGRGVSCISKLGKTIKAASKVTTALSKGMDTFDTVSSCVSLFDPSNPLVQVNQKLKSSTAYNLLQTGIGVAATFTGGATQTMKCFVAGTMVLTVSGLAAIESVRVGDVVISRNPETMETAPKRVLETYVRGDTKLIHLMIGGEEIITTETHPFYVNDHGFVNAADLYVGDELVTADNKIVSVEDYRIELTEHPTTVYNFKVEDFHTYFVGNICIWVHNRTYPSNRQKYMGSTPSKKSKVGQKVIERMSNEGKIRDGSNGLEFKASDGNWYTLDKADMAHKRSAVSWWNAEGRQYGAKSPEVRKFMKDPDNYYLELYSINRSQGPHNEVYLPPIN